MQISIDTSKDSHDHIKHVISMLQRIVDSSNTSVSSTSDASAPFAGLFGDSAPHPIEPHPISPGLPPPAPDPLTHLQELNAPKDDSPKAVDLWGNPKKEDDNPPVEVY
jgi:hypothetical protein